MNRLKHREISEYRQQQLLRQGSCCSLCGEQILDDAVLDHNHKTGELRQVLHRGCNSLLGKIENSMPMNHISITRLEGIARNLVNYLTVQHTEILHPTYKTAEERRNANKKSKRTKRGQGLPLRNTRKSLSNKSTGN